MAGYDIKKALDGDISSVIDIRINNLYPLLNELAEDGLVHFVRVEQTNRPSKKVYELTETGRKACLDALLSRETRQRFRSELLFLLKFAPFLPGSRIDELLENRMCELRSYLAALDDKAAQHGMHRSADYRFKLGLARAVLQAELEYIAENRDLLVDPRSRSESRAVDAPPPC